MPEYKYKAADETGKITVGEISAVDKKTAMSILMSMKLSVVSIKTLSDTDESEADKSNGSALKKGGGQKVALALFKKLQQLCGKGSMPVSDAIKVLSLRSLDKKIKKLARELYKDLSEGKTLATSLEKYPDTFDSNMTHLVEAGESTANLNFVFDNIVEYIEDKIKLRRTIISALAYPMFLCAMATGVVLLFMFFMLPKIKTMMANMKAAENLPIKLMNFIGEFFAYGMPVIIVALIVSFIAIKLYRQKEEGVAKTDSILLRLPALGKIFFDSDVCRFANLISTLFASGVNTTETFRLAEKSLKNLDMRARFKLFRTAVNDGAPISVALQRFRLLENEDVDVIAVGERTGSLVAAFSEIRRSHAESLERRIKLATTTLGGIALGGAFLLVLIFAMGIVLSILGLSQGMIPK